MKISYSVKNTIYQIMSNKLKMIDLFCGVGGFHQAASKTNKINVVYASDIDKYPAEVYKLNYGLDAHKDITQENEKKIFRIIIY